MLDNEKPLNNINNKKALVKKSLKTANGWTSDRRETEFFFLCRPKNWFLSRSDFFDGHSLLQIDDKTNEIDLGANFIKLLRPQFTTICPSLQVRLAWERCYPLEWP